VDAKLDYLSLHDSSQSSLLMYITGLEALPMPPN
jgi:hypothetical protein